MKKICVLAEKPSVGRDIARVLGCKEMDKGFWENDQYVVTWALGHLVTLADPEAYGVQYKTWQLDCLPLLPDSMELVVIPSTRRQFQCVKRQLCRADVEKIIIATDAGREGELVARWILAKACPKKPLLRLWISSVTDKAIREGFTHLRSGNAYTFLYASAAARAAADWYVGINATRALTCKFNAQLSCGRVQTPTLSILAKREQDIADFQPQKYYGLQWVFPTAIFDWSKGEHSYHTSRKEIVAALKNQLRGATLQVVDTERKLKRTPAPLLYDLTTLQSEANQRFSYSAKDTLAALQRLYENHKILTYPRTDSRYLTSDMIPTLRERLDACGIEEYSRLAFRAAKHIPQKPAFVNDARVSDHHAIIPTEQYVDLRALSEKERRIYDLVVRRFLAVFYPDRVEEKICLTARAFNEIFTARSQRILEVGWQAAYLPVEENDQSEKEQLPLQGNTDRSFTDGELRVVEGMTKPPARFTEGTLLAMENPLPYMEQNRLRQTMQSAGGLGTVATRADIIEKLFASFLIEKKGKFLYTTAKGRQLLTLVPEELRKPDLTAQWKRGLAAIADGRYAAEDFLQDVKNYARQIVGKIKESNAQYHHENLTRHQCPECGKFLLSVHGKHGKMLVCQDRACGYRKTLSRETNARCPECHKKMELRGQGDKKVFFCRCGYRETMQAFKNRRDSVKAGRVSRGEVSRYLRQQQESFTNSALADALAGLKLDQ